MTAASLLRQCKFRTLSFSGAGHLLPYHLGVATAIRTNEKRSAISKPIHAVSGSSSGAIAATIFVYFTNDRIQEYADRFISDGGRAMYHLNKMMDGSKASSAEEDAEHNASLHIATTRCLDGALRSFDFPPNLSSISNKDHLVKCLEASCKIPPHFHPSDVLPSRWPSTYAEEYGVLIDGSSYVDGGISAPAPPTPLDSMEGACRIVISPISGSNNDEENTIRISPNDNSWKFPLDIKCRGGFNVHPSLQNIKAMQVSAGMATSPVLREWYERGIED
eukprot:CAMPEP_0172323088 /NCGR_PEP_ID=MMETSP1058-20130122/47820_1 /TAXON_ID=83371 /ORGANISM="Detonula confervacea, Strain CCMP 353" /LENGTH=276 /DNA_ID=CAMNT_0013039005 /DNA_START=286 /DNA_END=1113 /DNA_ORIENTATION=+